MARIKGKTNPDGTITLEHNGKATTFNDPVQEREEAQASASNAKALLGELRARRGSLIEKHTIEGRDWFLLNMDQFDVNEVAIRHAATGTGDTLVRDGQSYKALIMAVLQVGVVKGERDRSPFFNPQPYLQEDALGNMVEATELELLCAEPGFAETIAHLFDRLTDMNPAVFPQKKIIEAASRNSTAKRSGNGSAEPGPVPSTPPPGSENSQDSGAVTPQ